MDWERNNFTVGQAIHQRATSQIIEITPATEDLEHPASGLSTGAIVSIVIGTVAGIVAAAAIAIIFIRARRRRRQPATAPYFADYDRDLKHELGLGAAHSNLSEIHGSQVFEMNSNVNEPKELAVGLQVSELSDTSQTVFEGTTQTYESSDKVERQAYEMP